MSEGPGDFVFGYASLVADLPDARVTRLRGYRRVLGVATDNKRAIPGYKRYLLRSDGSAPAIYVAFADLETDPDSTVNGVLAPVTGAGLAELDGRERNYDRIDVTTEIEQPPPGRIWTYTGSPAGRARLLAGRGAGRAAVSRDYIEKVHAGFRALGADEYRAFSSSSRLGDLPVLDLERIDLP